MKYILEGSVRKAANRFRIGVELVDATAGAEIWTQHFDRSLTDIFAVQDEIVSKVVATAALLFKLDEMKIGHGSLFRPTNNLQAFDDFLRAAAYYFRFTKDDNAKARGYLEDAIKQDPKFSEAYASLGWTFWVGVWSQWTGNPQGDLQRSAQLAQTALVLDDSNSDALSLLSTADWAQRRWDDAVAQAERAVALNPNSAEAYLELSNALSIAGRPAEGLNAAEKAIRLDPAARDLYSYAVGNAYNKLGRYQDAATVLERTVSVYPNLLVARISLTYSYVELGRERDGRLQAAEIMRISPNYSVDSYVGVKDEEMTHRLRADLRKAGLK